MRKSDYDLIEYKCSCCKNNYQHKFNEKLKERFFNTYTFCNHDNNKFILLLRKGVYPYEYMNDWKKFNEASLREKEDFYSHLNMEDITDADYAREKKVCKYFEIKNLREYQDLYVQSDILLLTDVFENFRNMYINIYELDPAKYLSASGLAWEAALKKIRVKLDILTDINMLLMVEKSIREGICHRIYRYTKANNKHMKDYDKNKESSYLQYWYLNNLYGWKMSQKLPINNFEWIKSTSQFNEDFIKNYDEESDEGYFLEVGVQYPEKLYELYNDFLFLPEKMKIETIEKLVANLHDKTEYVIRITNLKRALTHGLLLKKGHKAIKFSQNAWLKPYIDMNTDLRKKARNNFENDFFSLMNNAVFGKTMKNVRNHRNFKLVTTERRKNYLVSELNYHTTKYFTEHLLAIEMKNTEIIMNKPVYLGLSILELSKIVMYEFWYDYVKPK